MSRKHETSFYQSVGKDEVSGSNPDSSSKKTPVTAMVTGVFCFYETPAFLSFGVNLG